MRAELAVIFLGHLRQGDVQRIGLLVLQFVMVEFGVLGQFDSGHRV